MNKLAIAGFASKRTFFYESLAKAIEKGELTRTFLEAEIAIAKDPRTLDSAKAQIFSTIVARIEFGATDLCSQLRGLVPEGDLLMLMSVDRAEKNKEKILRAGIDAIGRERDAKKTLMLSILVPLLLVPVIVAFVWMFTSKFFPILETMAPPESWVGFPWLYRAVVKGAGKYGLFLFFYYAASVFIASVALPRWCGPRRRKLEQLGQGTALLLLPIAPWVFMFGIYRDFQSAKLLNTLAVLLKAGDGLTEALGRISALSSPWLRHHLQRVIAWISSSDRGTDYVGAFAQGVFSPQLLAEMSSSVRNAPNFNFVLDEMGTSGVVTIKKKISITATTMNIVFILIAVLSIGFLTAGFTVVQTDVSDAMEKKFYNRGR